MIRRVLWLAKAMVLGLSGTLPAWSFAGEFDRTTDMPRFDEPLRPQFHFTSQTGYINDPNGLFYLDGVYHLFFQRRTDSGKAWGHATSTDLVRWTQHDNAIWPQDGFQAYSGCAVVDWQNTSGFQTGEHPVVVAVFTSWGQGQSLAYSNDRGETWTRYEGNPVLRLPNDALKSYPLSARDPHVMWDAGRRRWAMVLYENLGSEVREGVARDEQGGFSLFESADLKAWTRLSHVPGFYVCPDVFELPVEGEDARVWVAMDWEKYAVGRFDSTTFTPTTAMRPLDFGRPQALSANQTWKHLPDGRVVQICWIRGGKYPGMPFDQQLSFPTELTLRRINDDLRLCKQPVAEIASLYGVVHEHNVMRVEPNQAVRIGGHTQSYDLEFELELEPGAVVNFVVLGQSIAVSSDAVAVGDQTGRPIEPVRQMRVLADRTSIEIYINEGETTMTFTVLPPDETAEVAFRVDGGGTIELKRVAWREVGSAWE